MKIREETCGETCGETCRETCGETCVRCGTWEKTGQVRAVERESAMGPWETLDIITVLTQYHKYPE